MTSQDSIKLGYSRLCLSEEFLTDLGDDFCRSLFVLCPLNILSSLRLRFMDYDYLFGIFKFVLHIKSKELLAEA
jgi:hypothetical protein